MRRAVIVTAAILAAVFLCLLATLPPAPATTRGPVDEAIRRRTLAGAFHVHSNRSDGAADVESIAAAASRAGLRFVVFTDHGDAARTPNPPAYLHGVLCIDGVEISTNGGHYIALDMAAAPYPLGGEAAAVVEDVKRLGGFGVVAHPTSAKPELAWRDWTLDVDAIEWLNFDSEWRDESRGRLTRAAVDYLLRPGPALASILDRPAAALSRWDALTSHRPVVAIAGHDAHGGITRSGPERGPVLFGLPSYEASFRSFGIRTILASAPTGDAGADARLVIDALRTGRVFTAIDAIAGPAFVDFEGRIGATSVAMGQAAALSQEAVLFVRADVPAGTRLALIKDGVEVTEGVETPEDADGSLTARIAQPGAYRIEGLTPRAPGRPPVPWLVTNPIYLGVQKTRPLADRPIEVVAELNAAGRVEKEAGSSAQLTEQGGIRALEYRLRSGERVSQYVALAIPIDRSSAGWDSLAFDARSAAPMRVSVQLRFDNSGGARWLHSVYFSPDVRRSVITVDRFLAAEGSPSRPDFSAATSLLFVVDLTNERPGGQGRFEVSKIVLGRASR
jgi:hypothetical protein